MRCTSTPITPEPSWRRANAAIAIRARSRIAPSEPSRSAAAICVRSASSSSSESSPERRQVRPRGCPRATAAISTARKKKRSNTSSNTRRSSWLLASVAASASRKSSCEVQLISREDRERVEHLRGADRDAFAAQLLAELEDPRGQALGRGVRGPQDALRRHRRATDSFSPTRSATTSMSVRCLTITDIVSVNVSASMSLTPSSSSARAQSIDSAIDGGFFRSSVAHHADHLDEPARDRLRRARARAGARFRARARARGSRATGTGSGA